MFKKGFSMILFLLSAPFSAMKRNLFSLTADMIIIIAGLFFGFRENDGRFLLVALIIFWIVGIGIELCCQWRENRKDPGFRLVP